MRTKNLATALATCAIATVAALTFSGCDSSADASGGASTTDESPSAVNAAHQKDAAWQPTHTEVGIIRVGQKKGGGDLHNFCLNLDGNVLACYGGAGEEAAASARPAQSEPPEIKVFNPDGKFLQSWKMEAQPQAFACTRTGRFSSAVAGELFAWTRMAR
jgi:hypothetical protein